MLREVQSTLAAFDLLELLRCEFAPLDEKVADVLKPGCFSGLHRMGTSTSFFAFNVKRFVPAAGFVNSSVCMVASAAKRFESTRPPTGVTTKLSPILIMVCFIPPSD